MTVEVIAVGTELLLGQTVNSNAAEIGRLLAESGLDHYHQVVVGDNEARLVAVIEHAVSRADAVILTGGIGPTQDDITREALAAAAGVGMVSDGAYADHLRAWWERRGREMPTANLRQAEHPEGAVLFENLKGTAPGLRLRIGDTWVFALPGVPQEMLPMLQDSVLPFLREAAGAGGVLISRMIRTWGESESRVAEFLGNLFESSQNPTMAFLASSGEIKVRLTARASDATAAAALLDPVEAEVRRRLGSLVFAVGDETVEHLVLRLCRERGWRLGTAESATGGMIAARLTAVPGASAVFVGSVIVYGEAQKTALLGVTPDLMEEYGVVGPETALAMAAGAARALDAEVVVAVTGSAGPTPQEAPPGTMVVVVHTPEEARARRFRMPGDRERVRTYTTTAALQSVRLALEGEWW